MLEDTGFYKIVASNQFGMAMSGCKLTVNEDVTDQDITIIDIIHDQNNRSDNTDNDVFEDEYLHISESTPEMLLLEQHERNFQIIPIIKYSKPKFIKEFDETSVKEGNELLLTCHVEGYPKPEVSW